MAATLAQTRRGAGSLSKAVRILSEMGSAEPEALRLTELVSRTGIEPSTAFRLLAYLTDEQFVEKTRGKRYRLGKRVFELGLAAGLHCRQNAAICTSLRRLAECLGTPVLLNVRSGIETVYIEREGPELAPGLIAAVGKRVPIGVGAGGVALLAELGHSEVDTIIRANEQRYRAYGTHTSRELRRLVERARAEGFARNVSFLRSDIISVGVVVPHGTGVPTHSISILLDAARIDESDGFVPAIRATACGLERIVSA